MAPFLWMGCNRPKAAESLFTTRFREVPSTHLIDIGRTKGWAYLGATQWLEPVAWTRDSWIGNPATQALDHCSIKGYLSLSRFSVCKWTAIFKSAFFFHFSKCSFKHCDLYPEAATRCVLKNFVIFTGKQLSWSLFVIKLWILRNF